MVEIVLKTGGAPGSNTDIYPNVSSINGQALSANTAGPNNPSQIADQNAAIAAVGTSSLIRIAYVDANATARSTVIGVSDIKSIL